MKLKTSLILSLTLLFYSVTYLATSKVVPCEGDCEKTYGLDTILRNKYNYYHGSYRCARTYSTDTLCVYVKDTIGINWDLFADTVCMYAKSVGLNRQQLLILNNGVLPPDTLARKQCP
jgi:hypothetical protein